MKVFSKRESRKSRFPCKSQSSTRSSQLATRNPIDRSIYLSVCLSIFCTLCKCYPARVFFGHELSKVESLAPNVSASSHGLHLHALKRSIAVCLPIYLSSAFALALALAFSTSYSCQLPVLFLFYCQTSPLFSCPRPSSIE